MLATTTQDQPTAPFATVVPRSSHERTMDRFSSTAVAAGYPVEYGKSFRQQRELVCIRKLLSELMPGGTILDLPCGTGRLFPLYLAAGLRVTGADVSSAMLQRAERTWNRLVEGCPADQRSIALHVCDAIDTHYENGQFDAVICNRLFHHFGESATRVRALAELRRISRGPVIVSFFNSFALSALRFRAKHWWRGTVPNDRIPISRRLFEHEAERAGLRVRSRSAVLWGLSPQWYLVGQRRSH